MHRLGKAAGQGVTKYRKDHNININMVQLDKIDTLIFGIDPGRSKTAHSKSKQASADWKKLVNKYKEVKNKEQVFKAIDKNHRMKN